MQLLKTLTSIHAPSGDEASLKEFILKYIADNQASWKVKPSIISDGLQDNTVLIFGKPKTAVYAHIDSIGFMVGYNNALSKIGGPDISGKWHLVGEDAQGKISGILVEKEENLHFQANRKVERGTTLTFAPDFIETEHYIQSPYLDNRLGVYNALKLCETLENGAIVFSTFEEHKGGAAQFLAGMLYQKYGICQALISDITWVTKGIEHGKGVAISLKDGSVPRKVFTDMIVALTRESGTVFQLEVENSGGSDGTAIQLAPFPIDWCFVGAPESHVHSPLEKVHKSDIVAMCGLYKYLMEKL